MDAAFDEFAEHGFRGATIKRIAQRARLKSQALIYWYFPAKEALFEAVLGQHLPILRMVLDPAPLLDRPPEEVLPQRRDCRSDAGSLRASGVWRRCRALVGHGRGPGGRFVRRPVRHSAQGRGKGGSPAGGTGMLGTLWGARAVAYRRERGWGEESEEWAEDVALAVVVQRMVAADAAGVAFTANPVTGARNEKVLSAVRGLGERLVSGEADADEWLVREGDVILRRAADCAITAEQAHAVADLARRIADAFGTPQDVEWAIADGLLSVLQARPMTALPDPVVWKAPLPADGCVTSAWANGCRSR